jgi:hypothetical protein
MRTKTCPGTDCLVEIPESHLACVDHWRKLSVSTRRYLLSVPTQAELARVSADAIVEMNS